jgi:hypothetical protein
MRGTPTAIIPLRGTLVNPGIAGYTSINLYYEYSQEDRKLPSAAQVAFTFAFEETLINSPKRHFAV